MRRSFASLALVFALAACTKVGGSSESPGSSRHAWTKPGVVRIGIQSEANNLNPVLASNTTENAIDRLLFDVLISADEHGKPVPMLAAEIPTLENGGISKDGLTITYELRSNVKWHDGVAFTSKDVKFSFLAMMNNANNVASRRGYDLVKSVETPNATRVVFHMKQKFAPAVNTLFAESDNPINIIPEHLLAKYHDLNKVAFNTQPIGTGPFKFVKWQHGDHIELAANDGYFLGKPKVRTIFIRTIPDENTMLNELRTHELDWEFEASPTTYKSLKTMPEITTVLVDHNGYEGIEFNTTHPPLTDVRVRQAIAYAIDRKSLVDNLTYGSAKVATEDLPDFLWAYNSGVRVYGFDLEKAKALMSQAGWKAGADGMLAKNGQRLALTMASNTQTNVTRRLAAVQVQAMLRRLGIDLQIKSYPGALLFAPFGAGGILSNGKYDLALSGWFAGIDPDDSSRYICAMIPPNGYNYTRYCKKEMDAAQQRALENFDEPTRKAAYATIETLLADDMPQLFLWWPRQAQPVNPDLKGFRPNPVTETWNAYQWAI